MENSKTPVDVDLYDECEEKAYGALDEDIIDSSQILSYTIHLYESKGGKWK